MAPHICDELWQKLGETGMLALDKWPIYDENLCVDEYISIPVQVNGKVRAVIGVAADATSEDIEKIALSNEKVAKVVGTHGIKKVIAITGKFINFLTAEQ